MRQLPVPCNTMTPVSPNSHSNTMNSVSPDSHSNTMNPGSRDPIPILQPLGHWSLSRSPFQYYEPRITRSHSNTMTTRSLEPEQKNNYIKFKYHLVCYMSYQSTNAEYCTCITLYTIIIQLTSPHIGPSVNNDCTKISWNIPPPRKLAYQLHQPCMSIQPLTSFNICHNPPVINFGPPK